MWCRLRATAASETLTPLGDKLGREGVRLTSFKVECTPSRRVFCRSAPTPVRRLRLACLAGCTQRLFDRPTRLASGAGAEACRLLLLVVVDNLDGDRRLM